MKARYREYEVDLDETHEVKSYGQDGVACRLCGIRSGDTPNCFLPCPAVTCPTCGVRSVPGKQR